MSTSATYTLQVKIAAIFLPLLVSCVCLHTSLLQGVYRFSVAYFGIENSVEKNTLWPFCVKRFTSVTQKNSDKLPREG
jgi:hypothetical protein